MYKFAASDTIFDGVSNIYLVSIATAFLAVIIAFYCSNFLKDESEKQLKDVLQELGDEEALEEEDDVGDDEEYLPNDSTTESELENHYNLKHQLHKRLLDEEEEEDIEDEYDCISDNEDNEIIRDSIAKHNGSNRDSDDDEDTHVDGLVGKMKSKRVKELEAQLTRDQLEEERRIEREQLAAIFELLKKQEAELNMKEIDENELNAQLSLYR